MRRHKPQLESCHQRDLDAYPQNGTAAILVDQQANLPPSKVTATSFLDGRRRSKHSAVVHVSGNHHIYTNIIVLEDIVALTEP